jgi:hypothetical protein
MALHQGGKNRFVSSCDEARQQIAIRFARSALLQLQGRAQALNNRAGPGRHDRALARIVLQPM